MTETASRPLHLPDTGGTASRPAHLPGPGDTADAERADDRAQRTVITAAMTGNAGYGLLSTITVLYFSTFLHLSASRIGLALTVAGVGAMLIGAPIGRLADTVIPPHIGAAVSYLLLAATEAGLLLARSFATLLPVLLVASAFQLSAATMRQTIVARIGGPRPATFRAKVSARSNLAMVLGMGASSLVIATESRQVYFAAILACCVLTAVQGLLMFTIPLPGPVPATAPDPGGAQQAAGPEGTRWEALRDLPYLTICALYGVLTVFEAVVTVALPLWIGQHTTAPLWLIAVFGIANALSIAFLLTGVGGRVNTPRKAGRALVFGGAFSGVFCVLVVLASGLPTAVAVTVLTAGVIASIAAELLTAAAEMELTMTLAPEHAKGQYLGLSQSTLTAGLAVGPSVATLACVTWGQAGWLLLAALFTAAGAAGPAITGWARRTRS
ncbi:Major Facilitator Superfamily protein [Streptomyces sp. YIM 121038]|uniref:MFS transporter n=1 Tax=Streptomyces sp. YIM 121038 TaxID=2136401 RepID=UPI0011102597|nr:MFS transporter [Streptomyces sp. YIM 121038]QCX80691.1 Major Facilitator Superfamily protein [Streptomyces sp. YIM 121038]